MVCLLCLLSVVCCLLSLLSVVLLPVCLLSVVCLSVVGLWEPSLRRNVATRLVLSSIACRCGAYLRSLDFSKDIVCVDEDRALHGVPSNGMSAR